jgi:hypothetical protein
MERCDDCDGPIVGTAEFRDVETVPARSSFQRFLAATFIPGLGQTELRRVRLCAACTAARDGEKARKDRGGVRFMVAVLMAFLLLAILAVVYISRLSPP